MKTAIFLVIGLAGAIAMAQERGPRGGGRPPMEVIKQCATELGITLPERSEGVIAQGSKAQISDADRSRLHECLEQKKPTQGRGEPADKAKVEQCLTEKGITLPQAASGERPRFDEATRKAMRECFEAARGTQATQADASGNPILAGSGTR
jgi:hypothetical protein